MTCTTENIKALFDVFRKNIVKGALSSDQVEGLNALIEAWKKMAPAGATREQFAYVLATAWHETAHTLQPIREYGKGKGRSYGQLHAPVMSGKSQRVQNLEIYYGRGYIQLTWFDNYLKQTVKLKIDLVSNPDLAMRPDIAAMILIGGMFDGDFTTRKLADYIRPGKNDTYNARRIVNGTDKATLIAGYAKIFLEGLTAAGF